MTGQRAWEIGLVSHCVPADTLDRTVDEFAARLALAGPKALRATKTLLNELDEPALSEAVRRGAVLSAQVVEGAEARAMLAKALGG